VRKNFMELGNDVFIVNHIYMRIVNVI